MIVKRSVMDRVRPLAHWNKSISTFFCLALNFGVSRLTFSLTLTLRSPFTFVLTHLRQTPYINLSLPYSITAQLLYRCSVYSRPASAHSFMRLTYIVMGVYNAPIRPCNVSHKKNLILGSPLPAPPVFRLNVVFSLVLNRRQNDSLPV